jgi:hypothetical protein
MQSQIYRILAARSGKPLRQIIRDTRRVDFYLDAWRAKEYGLIDGVIGASAPSPEDTAPIPEEIEASRGEPHPDSEMPVHGRTRP